MFERVLLERMKRIFDLRKITFDRPSESHEQECGFIEITNVKARIRDGRQSAHVVGRLHIFGPISKLPFGYLAQRIDQAVAADRAGIFFQVEENRGTYRDIVERSMGFVFLYDGQYDPAIGQLTEVNINLTET